MADDLDILTLDEGKQAVKLSTGRASDVDESVEQAITALSRVVDDLRGPVVARTIPNEVHVGFCSTIIPREQPVYAVTTLTEYTGTTPQVLVAENFPTATTAYDYWLDSDGIIHRHSTGTESTFAERVVITYEAGRYESTETVDAQFKKAAAEILAGNWTKFAAAWARGGDAFADPVFFDEVVNTLNRWVPYGGNAGIRIG